MDEPRHRYCLACAIAELTGLDGECDDCVGRDGTRWCEHDCYWMEMTP